MTEKVTKKMLSDCFKNLEKFNYLVKNFNGNRQIKFGAFTGFVDHLMISHSGIIFFIEAKLYKDKLKEKQEKLRDYLIESSKKNDFELFCEMMQMIENKEHLNKGGLRSLFKLKQQMH